MIGETLGIGDVFDLQPLAKIGAYGQRLLARLFDSLKGLVGGDDLLHFGFDRREVAFREGVFESEVVVKTAFDGWAEGELHAGEETHHRAGHDVGGRMPHDVESLRVFIGEQGNFHAPFGRQGVIDANDIPIDGRRQRRLGQPRPDCRRHVARSHSGAG